MEGTGEGVNARAPKRRRRMRKPRKRRSGMVVLCHDYAEVGCSPMKTLEANSMSSELEKNRRSACDFSDTPVDEEGDQLRIYDGG